MTLYRREGRRFVRVLEEARSHSSHHVAHCRCGRTIIAEVATLYRDGQPAQRGLLTLAVIENGNVAVRIA